MARQPDWDVDRLRGEEAEALYRKTREAMFIGEAEVKRDDMALNTGNFYFEHECNTVQGWKPSGIATTKATTWVHVAWPVAVCAPTWVVKNIAREAWQDPRNRKECMVGSHPTKGVIVPVAEYLPRLIEFVQRPADDKKAA